ELDQRVEHPRGVDREGREVVEAELSRGELRELDLWIDGGSHGSTVPPRAHWSRPCTRWPVHGSCKTRGETRVWASRPRVTSEIAMIVAEKLVGREAECAVLDGLLEEARAGRGAVLVVSGEEGVGKSSLLEYAAERAADFQVVRAMGVEAEVEL